jgi:hypothetical protein
VVVLIVIGVLAMLIAWHGDGQEVTRHTVEGFAQVRLGVWILVVWGLLGMTADADAAGETCPATDPGTTRP